MRSARSPRIVSRIERTASGADIDAVGFASVAFAATLEPNNAALGRRRAEVDALRAEGKPTVPTTIALEKQTNPFLRSDSEELRASIRSQVPDAGEDAVSVFAATRTLKDSF